MGLNGMRDSHWGILSFPCSPRVRIQSGITHREQTGTHGSVTQNMTRRSCIPINPDVIRYGVFRKSTSL